MSMEMIPPPPSNVVAFQRDRHRSAWDPVRTGNWAHDNAAGRRHAEKAVNDVRADDNPMHLVAVLRTMICRGKYEGVEAGFVQGLVNQLRT